jgi:small subunit ribosomal protein S4
MTKRLKQKYRICRQVGEDLWGRFFNINYKKRSGQHGNNRKKIKEFAYIFNKNKKKRITSVSKYEFLYKLRKFYSNISKKQFNNLNKNNNLLNINNKFNIHSKYLLTLLEKRLDSFIYRINWTSSFFSARQLISHGHVLVNGQLITNSSHLLNIGDKVEIKKKSFNFVKNLIISNLNSIYINSPSYIEVNYDILTAIFINNPHSNYIPYPSFRNIQRINYISI